MQRPGHILMVDDSRPDAKLVQEALHQQSIPVEFTWIANGSDALRHLRRQVQSGQGSLPDVILLDLNLPGISGWEVLEQLKTDESLVRIPVIILSTSTQASDIQTAYRMDANCYLSKPVDWDEYCQLVHAIANFWLRTATLAPSFRLLPLKGVA